MDPDYLQPSSLLFKINSLSEKIKTKNVIQKTLIPLQMSAYNSICRNRVRIVVLKDRGALWPSLVPMSADGVFCTTADSGYKEYQCNSLLSANIVPAIFEQHHSPGIAHNQRPRDE